MSRHDPLVWAAGRVRPAGEFGPDLAERSFRYGDGVFATIALGDGHLLDGSAHLDRLARSVAAVGLSMPAAVESVESVARVLDRMRVGEDSDGVVRIQVSAGPGGRGFGRPWGHEAGSLIRPTPWELVEWLPAPPSRRLTVAILGDGEVPCPALPAVKSCSALAHVLCAAAAERRGTAEALRVADGVVLEASAANVFWASGEALYTPAADLPLYPGVTRDVVVAVAARSGWSVRHGAFAPDEIQRAEGAFLTNAARGIEPIAELDGSELGWPAELEDLRCAVDRHRAAGALRIGS
jgi:branched-subunit amino acid aminotransferase/4-amino-4-deoxychorismate lyase